MGILLCGSRAPIEGMTFESRPLRHTKIPVETGIFAFDDAAWRGMLSRVFVQSERRDSLNFNSSFILVISNRLVIRIK
jgi:hypothetical protein